MTYRDVFDAPLSASDAAAVGHYDLALGSLITLTDDPLSQVKAALAIDRGLVMGHLLKSMLFALSSEQSLLAPAKAALEAARAVSGGANDRELAHIAALDAWMSLHSHLLLLYQSILPWLLFSPAPINSPFPLISMWTC